MKKLLCLTTGLALMAGTAYAEDVWTGGDSLPGVLTQVVANLIMNSVRHAFAADIRAEITISVQAQGDQVILDYRDNGVGVPQSLQERIFEPFFTTKRGSGGSGLGLNIVYNLVTRKLGGRLEFFSQPGEGVHFILHIPRELPHNSGGQR